ncbi:site-specific integrase [Bacteroidales bacterium OttesenSCG-928-I21]|nr:site-specific integrase [Bacteroidales bacterium OttesenSCG-928-I21]
MQLPEKSFFSKDITYYPAELKIGKIWYISYYVVNPYTGEMQRIREKFNRIKNIKERRKLARIKIRAINAKLEQGWNPLINDDTKMFVTFTQALDTFYKFKEKELEESSLRSYRSFLKLILEWTNKHHPKLYAGNFTKKITVDFMTSIRLNSKVSNSTYNNYLRFYRTLFSWLQQHSYVAKNYFTDIPKISKKKIKKTRRALTRAELTNLVEYLENENPRYLCVCLLCYYCLLRPNDIVNLKKENFDFERHIVSISENWTKNDNDSYRVIPKAMDKYLKCLDIEKMNTKNYIFSQNWTFELGQKQMDSRKIGRYWDKRIRPACDFGKDLQFYSLKDTGITNLMADGISPVFVQGQADHSSLEITNKYAHKRTPEGFEQIREMAKDVKLKKPRKFRAFLTYFSALLFNVFVKNSDSSCYFLKVQNIFANK